MHIENKRIIGNFLISFSTTWLATSAVGLGNEAFYIALINSIVMGMLSCGNELMKQGKKKGSTLHKIVQAGVVLQ